MPHHFKDPVSINLLLFLFREEQADNPGDFKIILYKFHSVPIKCYNDQLCFNAGYDLIYDKPMNMH